MTERQIRRLAVKIGFPFRVYFYSSSNHAYSDFGGVSYGSSGNVSLNRKDAVGHANQVYVKSLILHEMGHSMQGRGALLPRSRRKDTREARAQLWAVVKAVSLGWFDVAKYLNRAIAVRWKRLEWDHYKQANKLWTDEVGAFPKNTTKEAT